MGIAILMVIFYHQRWLYGGGFSWFHRYGEFGVDIFVFLSGIGIWHSLEKNNLLTYSKNRINRLLFPCLFAGIIKSIGIYFGYGNGVVKLTRFLSLDLWFIDAIILFYVIAPILHKSIKKYGWPMGIPFMLVGLISLFPNVLNFPWKLILARFSAFVFGMTLASNPTLLGKWWYLLSGLAFSLLFFIPLHCATAYLLFCVALPFCMVVTCLIIHGMGNTIRTIFSMIGGASLEIYLWHEYLFAVSTNEVSRFSEFPLTSFIVGFFLTIIAVIGTKFVLHSIR